MTTSKQRGPSPQTDQQKKGNRRDIFKTLLLVILLTVSLALVRVSPLGYYLDPSHVNLLRDKLVAYNSLAFLVFFAGGTFLVAVGVPRTIIHVLGGMVFGFLAGTLLSMLAALAGSVAIFWLTRMLGRPLFHQKIGYRLKTVEGYLKNNGLVVVLILRQLPLPGILINVLIALTSLDIGVFISGSIVGLLPEAVIFSLFGSSVREGFIWRVSMASCLLILLILAVRFCYRRSPLARELAQKLTSEKE